MTQKDVRALIGKPPKPTAPKVERTPEERESWEGLKNRPPAPPGFKHAARLLGEIGDLADFCAEHDPGLIAGGVMPSETNKASLDVAVVQAWLARFLAALGDEEE